MFVDIYPTASSPAAAQYRRTEPIILETQEVWPQHLYIGTEAAASTFMQQELRQALSVASFDEARSVLKQYGKDACPDVIFIDLPFNRTATSKFCFFLKDLAFLANTVIIYNETRLDAQAIKFLKQNQLVDEVLSSRTTPGGYIRKIEFLKKIKSRQAKLTVSWNGLNKNIPSQLKQFTPIKRTLDIVLATFAIIVFSPLFLLVALAIRIESKGPIFYAAPRAGRGFRVFKFYKFRTMIVNADQKIKELTHLNQYSQTSTTGASFLKISNDPRVTKVGRILRRTSLDEIPQFFNVLKGDMSFVGNRPLPLYEASTLTTNDCVERFMAPAGITGLWQIKKRGNERMSVEERVNLDISYARRANVFYDLWIMVKTPTALFQKSDA